jgi:tetratricopeptide (TPR) repeat protein
MMQSIVDRNRGFVTGDASAMGQQHLALSLSSARSLPVRGRRGGGWSAWKELAWLADADDANEERMVASHLPPTRVPSRQHVSTDLSHTLYSDLNSSRSENARSSFVPQPKNAWAEQQPNFSQPVSRRKQEDPSIEYYSAEIAGSARPASRAAVLAPTAVSSFQGSARNGTMLEQVHAAQHLPELPSHRHPSPHYRAKVESNQIAMAQGTEDFLSASQGFLREYNRLARLGLAQGNLPAAEVNITQAMDLIQQGDFSSTEVAAVTYNLLGCLHRREGRLNEAVDYLHRSLDILALRQQRGEALLERDVDLADIHMNMSSAQSALNRHDTALMHVETAIALLSERLGISQGQLPQESPSSEQDSKDLRMLAIAHYNRGAEMRTLKQDSTQAFEDALHLANKFLPPGDKLRAVIKKAQRRGGGARGVHKGDVQGVGAPPGVTPLRLSMLAAPGSGESSGRQRQPHSDLSGAAMRERERVRQQSISDMSYGGASSMGSARTALSSQSELTPQGWHKLHGVHRGTFASSARRSAREHGAADDTIPSSAQATASVTSMQVQTGLVRGSPPEGGAALPRNVFQRKHAAQLAGRDAQQQHAAIDENDEVLGLAQEHDMFSLIRAVPEGHAVLAASRYVPKDDKAKGLFDYVRSLDVSLIKPPPAKCESGTQVEHEFIADSSHTGPAEDRQARGYSSRDIVEQTVEQLVAHRARQELRGHDDVGGRDAWGLMSGSVNGVGTGGRGVARSAGRSLDRTYRKHLERTRQAHARYNKVATVLQLAYRCHLARQTAIELQRNPRHLKAMLAKTLHAFATLLQSNVRCMLAKRNVAKEANRRIMTAQDRWREQRNRAAYVIQAWFCEVVGARLMARRHSGPRDAAICLQHAFRCHRAR